MEVVYKKLGGVGGRGGGLVLPPPDGPKKPFGAVLSEFVMLCALAQNGILFAFSHNCFV